MDRMVKTLHLAGISIGMAIICSGCFEVNSRNISVERITPGGQFGNRNHQLVVDANAHGGVSNAKSGNFVMPVGSVGDGAQKTTAASSSYRLSGGVNGVASK